MQTHSWTCASALIALTIVGGARLDAATIVVPDGGNLQTAINNAQPGDTILLAAGAEFVGNFVLPKKAGDGYIVLRSSTPDSALPGPGQRITPDHAPLLARLRSANDVPALRTAAGAHHWRIQYLEFRANRDGNSEIIRLGDGSSAQNSAALVPHHIILEHVYVHGDHLLGQKRGIATNLSHFELRDSHISEIKAVAQDAQAVAGWNGPGPFTIENNYLEAAGENVLFGGSDPYILNLVADGIVIRRNLIARPMSWMAPIVGTPTAVQALAETGGALAAGTYAYRVVARRPVGRAMFGRSTASLEATVTIGAGGAVRVRWQPVPDATEYYVYGRTVGTQSKYWIVKGTEFIDTGGAGVAGAVPTTTGTVWTVKNLFELKNARNVLVEANIFENHWKQAQAGYSIVLTPRNSGNTCPWCTVENLTFQYNLVRNVASGVNILGYDSPELSGQANNLVFRHNVFEMKKSLGGNGFFVLIGDGPRDITLDHNTIDSDGTTVVSVYGGTSSDWKEVYGFKMTSNASRHGLYGMHGSYFPYGNGIINGWYPGREFLANYLASAPASRYPVGTLVAGSFPDQFVNAAAGDYTVRPGSILEGAGTDGTDIGADFAALTAALDGVGSGTSVAPLPVNQSPLAVFSFSCSALTCAFTDESSDADGSVGARSWTFGDGTSSSAQHPSHAFTAAGTYSVTLTVVDGQGASAAVTNTVTVKTPNVVPAADFTYSCVDLTCAFTSTSVDSDGTIASWNWSFGDNSSSAVASPTKPFGAAGTYSVTLTVSDNEGAVASVTKSVSVTAPIPPNVHAGNLSGLAVVASQSWKARITITVHAANEVAVAGAVVRYYWTWGTYLTCTTDSAGECTVESAATPLSTTSVRLTVQSIFSAAGTYKSSANHDVDGGSNGTAIRIYK